MVNSPLNDLFQIEICMLSACCFPTNLVTTRNFDDDTSLSSVLINVTWVSFSPFDTFSWLTRFKDQGYGEKAPLANLIFSALKSVERVLAGILYFAATFFFQAGVYGI